MQKLAPRIPNESKVRRWLAEAKYPKAGRDAIVCLSTCVSVAKEHHEWQMKGGEIHPDIIVNFNEANAAAEALKAIQQRLRTLERAYRQDGEPLPGVHARIRDMIEDEDVRFYLSPINPDFISRDFWWRNHLAFLSDGVIHALQLAGRDPKKGIGKHSGPVAKIVARALEFIDGQYVSEITAHSRLKRLNTKRKRSPAQSR